MPLYPDFSSRQFWSDFREWPFALFSWFRDGIDIELIGLDLQVLRTLGSSKQSSATSELMALEPSERQDTSTYLEGGAFYGSVFSDGSLVGELRMRRPAEAFPDFKWVEVEL